MVKEKIPSRIKPKNEAAPYIENTIKDEKAKALAKKIADRLYKEAKDNKMSLGEVASANGLEPARTELINRFDYIKTVGESYKTIDEAFKLKVGEVSPPIEVRKGFALIEPVEFRFIKEEVFEKEKASYRNKVLVFKKVRAFEEWFSNADAELEINLDVI